MTFDGLNWFRSRQRKLARGVLALFCLAWLQLAALPCVMASQAAAGDAGMLQATTAMDMAGGDHCQYCPPADQPPHVTGEHADCAYAHDPQVDSRAGFAIGVALPALAPVLVLAVPELADHLSARASPPLAVPRTPLAISYCRYLK